VSSYNNFANSLEGRVLVTARKLNALDESKVIGTATTIEQAPKKLTAIEMEISDSDADESAESEAAPQRTHSVVDDLAALDELGVGRAELDIPELPTRSRGDSKSA
jgi:hypothetical protein